MFCFFIKQQKQHLDPFSGISGSSASHVPHQQILQLLIKLNLLITGLNKINVEKLSGPAVWKQPGEALCSKAHEQQHHVHEHDVREKKKMKFSAVGSCCCCCEITAGRFSEDDKDEEGRGKKKKKIDSYFGKFLQEMEGGECVTERICV